MPKSSKRLSCSPPTHQGDAPPPRPTKESPPRSTLGARLEHIFRQARDECDIPQNEASATTHGATARTSVPEAQESHPSPPDGSRSLRRNTSSASIDTIRASSARIMRRHIIQMGPKAPLTQSTENEENAIEVSPPKLVSEPTGPSRNKTTRHKQRPAISTSPLQDVQNQPDDDDDEISAITKRLLQSASTVAWALQPSPFVCLAGSSDGSRFESCGPLSKENETIARRYANDERSHELHGLPTRTLKPGSHIAVDPESVIHLPRIVTHDIRDLHLVIRPYELDVTIWDEPHHDHYPFKCQLLLKCKAWAPFDVLSLPDVRHIEVVCNTLPVEGHYAVRPPSLLRTTYTGARIDASSGGEVHLNASDGIHIEKTWRTTLDGDGVWGWYVPVFIPVPMRLFDKMEYRKFTLVASLWMGESDGEEKPVEADLTFGMSRLLREVEMK
ncbi:hypothetical protein BU15DRAFT_63451 [Melanogaster broomeanus]|nr:hypothetical protein BU15DRAFT_63451 [Melanogaster broomeanus]